LSWSAEQVAALAPDASSLTAGRKLATARSWPEAGADERALWGLAQGSGKNPYQVAVDLEGPAYKCSCPSRKIPCKHALGLLLRWTEGDLAGGERPAFAKEWLEQRDERAAKRPEPKPDAAPDPEARARRAAQREARIDAGMEELDRWLRDLVRGGLAAAKAQPYRYWQTMAARLVDAQAPGVASRVGALSTLVYGDDWPGELLGGVARLHLLVRAWARRDELDEGLRASLRAAVGLTVPAEEVRARPAVRDRWAVLAQASGEDERLAWRRTWLQGERTGRPALILQFSGGGPFEGDYVPGTAVEGGLCFYPGAVELRALPEEELAGAGELERPPRATDVDGWLATWAELSARDPWLDRHVAVIEGAFVEHEDRWWVRDASGSAVALASRYPRFDLVAEAGGRAVTLAGEWRAGRFLPLAAFA
jgi:hypothetical protein